MRKAAEQSQDAAACASGGAIGDNGSTLEGLLVDRLSPIDRSVKTAWPVRKAAEQPQDAAACASGGAIGDNGSTLGGLLVDRLSPIDRSVKTAWPGEKSSRTALRRLRLRVGRSHWGQWLYTGRRLRLRVGRSHWGQWLYTGRLLWANRLLDRS